MDTDEVPAAAAAAAPPTLAAVAPAGAAPQRSSESAAAVSKRATPGSDDDDDDDDDDSDDSSFHGSDNESASGDDSDSDAGGKGKRGDRKAAARKSRAAGDAADAAAQDFDFGIDADELRDVREAAIEMYGEGILREGADGNAGGGKALSKDTLDKLWSDMLSEALLPTSIRALEQGAAVGADGAPNGLHSMGPRKRMYLALTGPASAGALSAVDRALLRANARAPHGSAAAKRARASAAVGDGAVSALLDQIHAFGAPLEAAAESCSKATPAAVNVSGAQAAHSEAAALRAAMTTSLRGKPSTDLGASTSGSSSEASGERPYFVTCDRSDVLGRPAKHISGAGLWMGGGSAGAQHRAAAPSSATSVSSAPAGAHAAKELRSAASRAREEASARTEAAWAAVSGLAPSAAAAATDVDVDVDVAAQLRAGRRAPTATFAMGDASVDADGHRSRLLAAAAAARETLAGRRIAVKQTVKFAGQTITVTKLVDAGTQAAKTMMAAASKPPAAAAAGKAPHADAGLGAAAAAIGPFAPGAGAGAGASSSSGGGGGGSSGGGGGVGIGAELANLDRPDAISTLAKSSLDWDSYKATQQLDDELAGAAKEGVGYVGKQAFLARVEQRQDDAALAKRAIERARASAASAAAGGSGF